MGNQTFNIRDVMAEQVVMGDGNNVFGERRASTERARESAGLSAEPVFGIVTALPEEFAAVRAVLDNPRGPQTVAGDRAQYVLGTLPSRDDDRPHEIVLTLLGDTGNSAAAESCANLIRSFPSVNTVVMCGIACGVPDPRQPERHVRLGDILVATWGIADYDHVVEDRQRPAAPAALPAAVPDARAAGQVPGRSGDLGRTAVGKVDQRRDDHPARVRPARRRQRPGHRG